MNKEQLISKAKELILEDMAKKVIPMNVQSFSDLHKYVDANAYVSNNFQDAFSDLGILKVGMLNEVIEEVCDWINGEFHATCRNLMDNINERLGIDATLSLDEYYVAKYKFMLPIEREACEFMLGNHPMLNIDVSDEIKTFDGLLDGNNDNSTPYSCDNPTCRKEYGGDYNGGYCSDECKVQ